MEALNQTLAALKAGVLQLQQIHLERCGLDPVYQQPLSYHMRQETQTPPLPENVCTEYFCF